MHGREKEAEASIAEIEADVAATKGEAPPVDPSRELEIRPTEQIGHLALLRSLFQHYPSRAIYGGTLMNSSSADWLRRVLVWWRNSAQMAYPHAPQS